MKSMNRAPRGTYTSGFTLIELLTVIAIIAVLTAIIFPVFGAVQENARRASCMTNMKTISTALKQYELDNRKYPDFLFAPAIAQKSGGGCQLSATGRLVVSSAAGTATCTPEEASATGKLGGAFVDSTDKVVATGGLYPEYIKSYNTYHCPNNTWFYPTGDRAFIDEAPTAVGYPVTAPKTFFNADYNKADTGTLNDQYGDTGGAPALRFYKFDSYGVGPFILTDGAGNALPKIDVSKWAVRYRRQWMDAVADPTSIPAAQKQQYQNQLMWRNPSDDAPVTMCSHHAAKGKVITLFLSGTAKVQDLSVLKNNGAASTGAGTDFDTIKMTP